MIRNQPRTQVRTMVGVPAVVVMIAFLLLSSFVLACRSEQPSLSLKQHRRSLVVDIHHQPSHRRRNYDYQQKQQQQQQQMIDSSTIDTRDDEHVLSDRIVVDDENDDLHVSLMKTTTSALATTTNGDDSDPLMGESSSKSSSFTAALHLSGGSTTAALPSSSSALSGVLHRLKVGSLFFLWYALNIVYNIKNKQVLNVLPAPLIVGTLQLLVGAVYVSILWSLRLRTRPHLTSTGRRAIQQIGIWHSLGQLFTMVSLGAGPVSFTHIVKAMEPFFSALVSALISHKWMAWYVYATLLPVVGGVGYASYKETNFSWLAFGTAMGSNLAFALRAVLSKVAMTPKKTTTGGGSSSDGIGTALTPPNVFALVTWAAFWISIPLAILGEGSSIFQLWKNAVSSMASNGKFDGWLSRTSFTLWRDIIISGFFHYMNNEVMYLALSNVHPVTLAVGNTMKRVFILVASVLFFQNDISLQSAIGAAVGIAGVLLYSLTLDHYTAASQRARGVKA